MTFDEICGYCHVRSAIYNPKISNKRYWKNSTVPLNKQVPFEFQEIDGWKEYDPREEDDCSLFMFND